MDWTTLLSSKRLRRIDTQIQVGRSQFQQDIDRIVFSAAFRRLAHKTQVHPLAENDHVHTRLTHSIEVSSVGRSLGTIVGSRIAKTLKRNSEITGDTFGYVVQAACLAHDIGNPPFGHSGEDSISNWFHTGHCASELLGELSDQEKNDLLDFEGNAQGFRILTQLENNKWNGGLQLTFAVLGTFSKYPRASAGEGSDGYIGDKKIGYFYSENEYFNEVATELGLIPRMGRNDRWCRHPLAFLVEAADDICYAIVDIEDGYELGYISYRDAKEILESCGGDRANLPHGMEEREIISKLRAVAIGELVTAASEVFYTEEKALLDGSFSDELLARTKYGGAIRSAKETAKMKIYQSRRKTEIEIAGSEIISGLLDNFGPMLVELEKNHWNLEKLPGKSQKIVRILPDRFLHSKNKYDAIREITDFVSGMTDRYALHLYQRLKGITI